MKIRKSIALFVALLAIQGVFGQAKKYIVHTVAFYNLENLFDIENDPAINDEEWLPGGPRAWSEAKYKRKLDNLSRVLSEIGTAENPNPPTLIGASEIENRRVLEDLVKQPRLIGKDYGIVH
ncbi:MAG TPA: endonuclease/exonuclease/phosphatase family protein, partial [Flavobacterium sp.]|nr:endonuclease/exonuclease/phosphatase family protein [Flavobacterium sp.]